MISIVLNISINTAVAPAQTPLETQKQTEQSVSMPREGGVHDRMSVEDDVIKDNRHLHFAPPTFAVVC